MAITSRSPFMQASSEQHQRQILADARFAPGNVWFVCSAHANAGNSAGKGQTPDAPFSSIDYAVGLCTANQGDLIIVMQGHVETISAAGSLTCDVAGIDIIGLGRGTNRPKLNFTGTAGTVLISAANVALRNMYATAAVDEVVSMFNITAAYCELDRIDYLETSASFQAIQYLLTDTGGNFLWMHDCFCYQDTAPTAASIWIQLVAADGARIEDNVFHLKLSNASGSYTIGSTTASLGLFIHGNRINQIGGTTQDDFIILAANTTGLVSNNRIGGDVGTLAASVDLASAYGSENYIATTANKSGILDPVVA